MKVKVKDDAVVTGEMGPVYEIENALVFEMVTDPAKLADIGFSQTVVARAAVMREVNADDAEFPVIRTEEGWSGSGRLWDGDVLDSIAEQTNALEPVGHLGHIPDEQAATSMPEPQTTWLGAFTRVEKSEQKERLGEMVKVLYTVGSNLPGAKVRALIKNRAVRGTSWWGRARQVPVPGKGVKIEGFKLLAIDWARKGSEGMPTSRIVAMAREMTNEGKGDKMDKELSAVTPDEFKAGNPNGYALLVSEMTKEKDAEIATLTEAVEEAEESKTMLVKLCETLGVTDPKDLLAKVNEIKQRVGDKAKASVDAAIDKLLAEKVSDPEKRPILKRLIPVGEMETKAADVKTTEEVEALVGEMIDVVFNSDEIVKGIVSEMAAPLVRRREDLTRQQGSTATAVEKSGMTRERVTL